MAHLPECQEAAAAAQRPGVRVIRVLPRGPEVSDAAAGPTLRGETTGRDGGDAQSGRPSHRRGGTDVLALYGSGTFHVDQLATFTGFASITLNNFTSCTAILYLGASRLRSRELGHGSDQLYLGSGAVTFHGWQRGL